MAFLTGKTERVKKENKKMALEKCPNNPEHKVEKLGENKVFCPACNETYTVSQGKTVPDSDGSGRLKKIEEEIARTQDSLKKLAVQVIGQDDADDII